MTRDASATGPDAEPQIFISYARQDAERVLAIARLLDEQGATVWRDADRILGGQYYGEQIVHAIAHSKVVLLMCSPQAFQSDNVHREVLLTWDHYHRRYLPIWLCPPTDVPERFRYCLAGCQWIDAHSQPAERWLPQMLKAFRALGIETRNPVGPRAEATPGPADPPAESPRRGPRFHPGDRPIRGADWELERLLGKGGFGEVWKAHNPHLPGLSPVALKFCLVLDERSRERLRHEANMVLQAQRQIRSDGIVPLLHAYLSNDPPCLEFPYVAGGTLVRLLDERRESAGSFTPMQAQRIVQRIAQIVGPAHRATPRLIHRDLKPSNVLVERKADGRVMLRVTDFGIGAVAAQPVLEHSRSSSSLEGNRSAVLTGSYSPLYASPQQMRGDKADPRDDVYALGVIWYQLLKGDLASPAPTGRRWIDVLRSRGMSDGAIDALSSCFEDDPAYRPADAAMLAEQLRGLSASDPSKSAGTALELTGVEPVPPRAPAPSSPAPRTEPRPPPRTPHPPSMKVTWEELTPDANPEALSSPVQTGPAARTPTRPTPVSGRPDLPKPASPGRAIDEKPVADATRARTADSSSRPTMPEAIAREGKGSKRGQIVALGMSVFLGFLGVVLYVVTDQGTVKITGTDPRMSVLIDGEVILIENLGPPITLRTGPHKLLVQRDGLETHTEAFSIQRGKEKVLDVTYTPKLVVGPAGRGSDRPGTSTGPSPVVTAPPAPLPATPSRIPTPIGPGPTTAAPPEDESRSKLKKRAKGDALDSPESITTRVGQIELKLLPAGTFLMGSPDGEGESDEHPQHRVRITRPFYLGTYEVTQAQYQAVMGVNPSWFSSNGGGKDKVAGQSTDRHPVEEVSWLDAVTFCNKLSEMEGLKPAYAIEGYNVRAQDWDEPGYRLPTEAEWEYACRANTQTRYSCGDDETGLGGYGWFDGNSGGQTHAVGGQRPNGFGLFDMHGNVWEWCWDEYGDSYYRESSADDPHGPNQAARRVFRGGSWRLVPRSARSALRSRYVPVLRSIYLGFRLARVQSVR